jgi:hypothetical protein
LGDLGSDVNITLVEMRKRRRIAELLETAKSLSDVCTTISSPSTPLFL